MKILIATGIYPPSIGGPATYSKLLFDELPKRGIDVKVVSFDSVRKYPKGISHFIYLLKLIFAGRKVDAIYAQDPISVGFPAMWASRILKKKLILKVVGDYAWEQSVQRYGVLDVLDDFVDHSYSMEVERLRKIERDVAKYASKIIVPSRYLKKIVSKWGVDDEKINVIYNAFDGIPEEYNKKELRNILGFNSPIVMSSGRLVPWKGFHELILCMNDLKDFIPGIRLFIAGEGPDREKLEAQVSELNLGSTVTFLGSLPKEKLFQYIKASDLFVLNTSYEGFSHQILEVLALKTPVMTTDVGGNPEIIESGKDGVLFSYNNTSEIKAYIKAMIENPEKREEFSENGLYKVSEFSTDRMLGELEIFLKENI